MGGSLVDRQAPEVVKGEQQAILRRERIECAPEDPTIDLSIQVVNRCGNVRDKLDGPAATFHRTQSRADNLTPEPRSKGIVVAE